MTSDYKAFQIRILDSALLLLVSFIFVVDIGGVLIIVIVAGLLPCSYFIRLSTWKTNLFNNLVCWSLYRSRFFIALWINFVVIISNKWTVLVVRFVFLSLSPKIAAHIHTKYVSLCGREKELCIDRIREYFFDEWKCTESKIRKYSWMKWKKMEEKRALSSHINKDNCLLDGSFVHQHNETEMNLFFRHFFFISTAFTTGKLNASATNAWYGLCCCIYHICTNNIRHKTWKIKELWLFILSIRVIVINAHRNLVYRRIAIGISKATENTKGLKITEKQRERENAFNHNTKKIGLGGKLWITTKMKRLERSELNY